MVAPERERPCHDHVRQSNGTPGGWATVTTPTGDFFATVTGGEIVAFTDNS